MLPFKWRRAFKLLRSSACHDHASLNKCVDWTCAQLFFFINQSANHVCAEPKILIRTDHGSMMIHCTTTVHTRAVMIHVSKLKWQHSDPRTCLALWEGRIATQSRSALWVVSNTTLTPQRLFPNSLPLFIHTERNTAVKTNHCVIHTESRCCGS